MPKETAGVTVGEIIVGVSHEYPQAQELPPLRLTFIAVSRWSDGTSVAAN